MLLLARFARCAAIIYNIQIKHRHVKRAGVIFFDRSIPRTVYSNDLFKFFLVAMYSKKETGNLLYIRCYVGNGKIAT